MSRNKRLNKNNYRGEVNQTDTNTRVSKRLVIRLINCSDPSIVVSEVRPSIIDIE
jgi:hypothetical protein